MAKTNIEIAHNKKRNVGIVYELLLRSVSSYLIDGNKKKAQDALDIITSHYDNKTELYKEFRLFNALAKTTVSDTSVAALILSESKQAVRRFDNNRLTHEKAILLKTINHTLNDNSFFHRWVPNYKELATIQTLINEWQLQDKTDLVKTVMLECKMAELLLAKKQEEQTLEVTPNVDNLVIKIMGEKFNKKYSGKLSSEQSELIREYVTMPTAGQTDKLTAKVNALKKSALDSLSIVEKTIDNNILKENIALVRSNIESLDLTELDDKKFGKLMTLAQMVSEVKGS